MPSGIQDLITLASTLVALVSALAAVLAWLSKLRWSAEYKDAQEKILAARDAEISLLKQQIATMSELTPLKLQEHHKAVVAEMESLQKTLEQRVRDLHTELDERERKIRALEASGHADRGEIDRLRAERETLQKSSSKLEVKVADLGKGWRSNKFKFDLKLFEELETAAKDVNDASDSVKIDWDAFEKFSKLKRSFTSFGSWSFDPDSGQFLPDKPADKKEKP